MASDSSKTAEVRSGSDCEQLTPRTSEALRYTHAKPGKAQRVRLAWLAGDCGVRNWQRDMSLDFHLGRLFPELGLVLRNELVFQFRMMDEALRVRTVMLLAPIALLLKLGG